MTQPQRRAKQTTAAQRSHPPNSATCKAQSLIVEPSHLLGRYFSTQGSWVSSFLPPPPLELRPAGSSNSIAATPSLSLWGLAFSSSILPNLRPKSRTTRASSRNVAEASGASVAGCNRHVCAADQVARGNEAMISKISNETRPSKQKAKNEKSGKVSPPDSATHSTDSTSGVMMS